MVFVELVRDAISLYDRERGLPPWVELKTTLSDDLPSISADPDLMFQVLQNLILNAVEAMESTRTGGLTLSTTLANVSGKEYCTISVTDEGNGVPAHLREAIFEPNVTTRSWFWVGARYR